MTTTPLRVVFFGTPEFAKTILEALVTAGHFVVACVCQPDKPKGRSPVPAPPPTKVFAQAHGIDVLQPTRLKTGDFPEWLESVNADVAVVAAYGRILPLRVLQAPRFGCINVHASLLPEYRGAAPIQRAILDGKSETGVTIMQMDEGLDTGAILLQKRVVITETDTSQSLHDKLAGLGAAAAVEALNLAAHSRLTAVAQDESRATIAPLIHKEDGFVVWQQSAVHIHRLVRAMYPWPGVSTRHQGAVIKIFPFAQFDMTEVPNAKPGTVMEVSATGIRVACGVGTLVLTELQLEGRKRMPVKDFISGHKITVGEVLG